MSKESEKLADKAGVGRTFYDLRHTFATIAGGSLDQVAVNAIMGHADASMAAAYRETIADSRLLAVVNHVHAWLYPPEAKKTRPAGKAKKELGSQRISRPSNQGSEPRAFKVVG